MRSFVVGIALGFAALGCARGASAQVKAPVFESCPMPAEPSFEVLPRSSEPLFRVYSRPPQCLFPDGLQTPDESPELSPERAFLYSALIPGLGQQRQGKVRWVAYLAIEAASWIAYGHATSSATHARGQYRDLAWDIARTFTGPRLEGDFPYYETMEKFLASGALDADAAASGIQPQMDASTFNGQAWILSTEIHFPPGTSPSPGDPAYEAALVDYIARGYDARFEWSWAGQSAAWTEYMDLIESSDDYARRASRFLGVVIANHLLSGIDAFLTARIRQAAGPGTDAQIRLVPMDDMTGFGRAGRGPRRLGRRGLSPGGLGLVLRVGL